MRTLERTAAIFLQNHIIPILKENRLSWYWFLFVYPPAEWSEIIKMHYSGEISSNEVKNIMKAVNNDITPDRLKHMERVKSLFKKYRIAENKNYNRYTPGIYFTPNGNQVDSVDVTINREQILWGMGELPRERRKKYIKEWGLSEQDAKILTKRKETAIYFEEMVKYAQEKRKNE